MVNVTHAHHPHSIMLVLSSVHHWTTYSLTDINYLTLTFDNVMLENFDYWPLFTTGLRGSLSRLQLDYVDIVFANRNDVNSPMEGQL